MLEVGLQAVPGYRLSQQLGKGAFGEVWEALNADGAGVALKFMDCRTKSPTIISSEVRVLRGLRELKHPGIIQLLSVSAYSHYIVLVMERADGNLDDLKEAYLEETGKPIPTDHLLELLEQVAEVLDFLAVAKVPGFNQTSVGLQHCDIKPSNILLMNDRVKVGDFGLCASTAWQTHRDSWKGTLPYAAPELYRGLATVGTDQFALAVTYCELCAGERPFFKYGPSADRPPSMPIDLTKIREREVPIIGRALHTLPSSRYPSCRAFITALREAVRTPRRPLRNLTRPLRTSLARPRV